tara:strand:+ start:156 stop:3203 length:3048 start_codon:yes stop_codon:yes gene_type:complete
MAKKKSIVKKGDNNTVLIIVAVVALIILISFVSENSSETFNSSEINEEIDLMASETGIEEGEARDLVGGAVSITYTGCSDSDGGHNYFEDGTVRVNYINKRGRSKSFTRRDRCATGSQVGKVIEYYCDGDRHRFERHVCSEGCNTELRACEQEDKEFAEAILRIDGRSYKINSDSNFEHNDFDIVVDVDGNRIVGDSSVVVIGDEQKTVKKNDLVYLKSYGVVQYKGSDKSFADNPVMKFKDIRTGETIELSYVIVGEGDSAPIDSRIIIAVNDNAPATDVILATDVATYIQSRDGQRLPMGAAKLFSEVNENNIGGILTIAIYQNRAVIIVGENADSELVILATDVSIYLRGRNIPAQTILSSEVGGPLASLFVSIPTPPSSGGGSGPITGSWIVGTDDNKLELSEEYFQSGRNFNSRETLRSIKNAIDGNELEALKDNSVSNNKGDSKYSQKLEFLGADLSESNDTGFVGFFENDRDIIGDYLYFKSGRDIGTYKLDFNPAIKSDVDNAVGSLDSRGLHLTDYNEMEFDMFGKKFTMFSAKRVTTNGNDVKLVLFSGSSKAFLNEGVKLTHNIGGTSYDVNMLFVDSDEAQLNINGQNTRKLKIGETDKLFAGTDNEITVGVTSIIYQDYAAGIHAAGYSLGREKIELRDNNIGDSISSHALKVNDNTIDKAKVIIKGKDEFQGFEIDSIHVQMEADDDFYVGPGKGLKEIIEAENGEGEVLFSGNWDIKYDGLGDTAYEDISITTSGTKRYNLNFNDGNNNAVSLPLAELGADGLIYFGEKNKKIINSENSFMQVRKDYYIILSPSQAQRGSRPTYILQYKGADKVSADNPVLKFKDLGSGETLELAYSNNANKLTDIKIGGYSFGVYTNPDDPAFNINENDFIIRVDLNGDGRLSGSNTIISTKNGMEITPFGGSDDINVQMLTPLELIENKFWSIPISLSITRGSNNNLEMENTGWIKLISPDSDTNVAYGMTRYGGLIKYNTPDLDPNTISIKQPNNQLLPTVRITTGS